MLPFKFNQFGIQYTNICNYQCRHCGTGSGPAEPNENLGQKWVQGLVGVLPEFGFSEVSLTGGECLIFKDDIISIIQSIKLSGMASKVITNGDWGRSYHKAARTLGMLADAGLSTLAISYDIYRREWGGTIQQVQNIIKANTHFGDPVNIFVYSVQSFDTSEQDDLISELASMVSPENMFLQRVIPVGRAVNLRESTENYVDKKLIDKPCYQVFAPFLNHKKQLYRCCSGAELGGDSVLYIGDISGAEELRTYLNQLIDNDSLHKTLAALGPSILFRNEFETEESVTLCDFCLRQMRKEKSAKRIRDFTESYQLEIDETYLTISNELN